MGQENDRASSIANGIVYFLGLTYLCIETFLLFITLHSAIFVFRLIRILQFSTTASFWASSVLVRGVEGGEGGKGGIGRLWYRRRYGGWWVGGHGDSYTVAVFQGDTRKLIHTSYDLIYS